MGSRGSASGGGRSKTVLGYKAYETMPKGWQYTDNATTAPFGYAWANNGKSRFSDGYESALVRDELTHFRPIYSTKDWLVTKDRVDGTYKIQTLTDRAGLKRVINAEKNNGEVIIRGGDANQIPKGIINAIKKN